MKVLVFAYYSIKDPVFQSAVLAYLKRMPSTPERKFVLVTFESKRFPLHKKDIEANRKELLTYNIIWKRLYWHSGSFKLLKKIYDFKVSFLFCLWLIFRYRIDTVYSEGFPGAIIAHYLSRLTRTRHIVHSYEPHADYMLEGGTWTAKSWEYHLLKKLEKQVGAAAEVVITGTAAYKKVISRWGANVSVEVLPSCIDLGHFRFLPLKRDEIRDQLGIEKNDIVLVYLGKFGGMYMEEEIFRFFHNCEKEDGHSFRYWIFSGDDHSKISSYFDQYRIPKEKRLIKKLSFQEVPEYLSAADIGLVAVRTFPSKRFCSPIKTGEYWACGLPVIIPEGIGDDYKITKKEELGVVVKDFSEMPDWKRLKHITKEQCRKGAETFRSLDVAANEIHRLLMTIDNY